MAELSFNEKTRKDIAYLVRKQTALQDFLYGNLDSTSPEWRHLMNAFDAMSKVVEELKLADKRVGVVNHE